MLLCGLLLACGQERDLSKCWPTCGAGPFYAISELTFVTASTDGVALGFNLDGLVSDGRAKADCNTADFVSPSGEPGIDNKLAWVLALLGDKVLTSITERFQQAINDGGFLFTIEQIEHDNASDLVFRRGAGQPVLDSNQRLQPGQTLSLHAEPFFGSVKNVQQVNGKGTSPAFNFDLRFASQGRPLALRLLKSRFRYELLANHNLTGIFGGAVTRQDAVNLIVGLLGGDEQYRAGVEAVMPALADMVDPKTGKCDHFSLTVAYIAVPIKITAD